MSILQKILLSTLLFVAAFQIGLSQEFDDAQFPGQFGERVQAMKVAFMTNKLSLSPEQAEKFWPIYNEYQEKQTQLKRAFRKNKNINLISDDEVEQFINERFKLEEELLNLKKDCYQKLKSAISIRQIANIGKAENEFKATLLKEMQKFRKQRGKW